VETGGGYHAYYRHNGGRRHIRPFGPHVPLDILGGGYVIGPHSVTEKGPYQLVRGTLEDLTNLPPLHRVFEDIKRAQPRAPIKDGNRNKSLFHLGLEHAAHVEDRDELLDVMRTHNMDAMPPVDEDELGKAADSAWKYEQEGRNLVGRGKPILLPHGLFDQLTATSHDALILLLHLKRHHWGRNFALANAMAAATVGWRIQRVQKSQRLVGTAWHHCLHPHRRSPRTQSRSAGLCLGTCSPQLFTDSLGGIVWDYQ
jgi:primase-like protein